MTAFGRVTLDIKTKAEERGYRGKLFSVTLSYSSNVTVQALEVAMDLSFHNRTLTISMQVKERIRRTGYTPSGFKVWTAEEDEIVKSLYPLYAEMQLRFPERSLKALHGRCERLGIAKKLHWWTAAEISKLRRLYPTASRDLPLNFHPVAIRAPAVLNTPSGAV
ncbi:hypothetical protein ABVB70_26685, partial [Agrobacterium radiobacter]